MTSKVTLSCWVTVNPCKKRGGSVVQFRDKSVAEGIWGDRRSAVLRVFCLGHLTTTRFFERAFSLRCLFSERLQ